MVLTSILAGFGTVVGGALCPLLTAKIKPAEKYPSPKFSHCFIPKITVGEKHVISAETQPLYIYIKLLNSNPD